MKKHLFTFLILTLAVSCNSINKEQSEIAEADQENVATEEAKYKLSLAQWSLHNAIFSGEKDPMNFAADAKNMGFAGLEYVSQLYTGENVNFPMKNAGLEAILQELKRKSDSLGMKNLLIMIDGEGDLSFNDKKATQQAIENHKKWIDAAQYLGAHSIRVNLFGESDAEAWVRNSVSSLKALGAYAKSKNVNVIVENHGGLSSNAALLAEVMQNVGMDNIGTLPDFGNFCLKREGGVRWGAPCVEEYDRYKGIAELMPYAKGVSAKSYDFDAEGNETTIDYGRMMQIVKDSDFQGFVGIEYEGTKLSEEEGIMATKALVIKSLDNTK